MQYYIGVDWADAAHAIWVEDEQGAKVLTRTVPHTAEGLAEWGRWLDEQRARGLELWAAIERPDGRVVDFLLDHGVIVYPINPKALDRARDRYRTSASKSDGFDAHVLASFLRTDQAHLQALQPSSAAAQELKLLTRDYSRLVREQTRLVNQLTATLKEYHPRVLEVCADLTAKRTAAFLRAYPTPTALGALNEDAWQQFATAHRWNAEQAAALWSVLHRPQIPVPEHVARAKSRLTLVLLQQLETVVEAVDEYRKVVMDFFASLPAAEWATTLPASQGTLVPTIWAELGDALGRWRSWQHLQGHSGVVPVTRSSGKSQRIAFRFACNLHLRRALQQFAFCSLKSSEWARAYYDRQRARGHRHQAALRALAAKWVKIIFVLWSRQIAYDENYHLAMMARQHLRQAA
ncbi:MAG TPA: transposase [Candidatus Bathyarchaeia archaeon]|nr:transposase [Candidatus Bathyarchaeia archaeon]